MASKVIYRNLFLFAAIYFGLISNVDASANFLRSEPVIKRLNDTNYYSLMSQQVKSASDVKIVMKKKLVSEVSSSKLSKDWRDTNWKDPFGPKVDISKRSEVQIESDITIILEQGPATSPPSNTVHYDLMDPFAPTKQAPEISDPFEDYNRFMFGFNEGVYDNLLEPIARGYRDFIAEDIRMAISNIFDNALAPVKLVSSFLQGDLDKTGRVIGRTLINTTLGIGGIFDVADKGFGISSVNEDLDQTLGSYGVPTGPYIVLPLLGPTTVRGIFGKAGGSFLSPTFHFAPGFEVGAGLTVSEKINQASFILDDKKQLEESTIDEYESMKDFYNQYRFGLVNE